ncbi:hypothetical protein B0O99DRAFT_655285 [Bisporella sp. PMI_857]|nr:hypothetical protein B0O99DRAFT_655285 [Bisporella sp. PMI_857]
MQFVVLTLAAASVPEPIEIIELPLPPVSPSDDEGACTAAVNPQRTGCISKIVEYEFQAGDFTPDGNHIVATIEFTGAPAAPDPASIYLGEQLVLIKADGTKFPNGDSWKCLSCGVPAVNLDQEKDYPHAFRSGKKVLWGHNILDCEGELVTSHACTPAKTHIYPIHWTTSTDGSGPGGSPRELRLHPDDVHLGFSSFTLTGGQFTYFGRLQFNAAPTNGIPLSPRYDLVNVNVLDKLGAVEPIEANGDQLTLHDEAIAVGELRGFSGSGDEITYIGSPREANNIDLYAVHIVTGRVRRLTSHPEYADPLAFSPDNQWFVTMDTRGSDRQMWMSGMRGIPPLIDIVTVTAASSTRNNGARRFFQPILIDRYGDRGDYFGQQINAAGDRSNGAINDPNWNGRADPAFSLDSTKITYWQALVTSPACGGINPLVCPVSTAQGGRNYRLMIAKLTSRKPTRPAEVFAAPDNIPWGTPFPPGSTPPASVPLTAGNYTLKGKVCGSAKVRLIPTAPGQTRFNTVAVNYTNYSDDGKHILNGYEQVKSTPTAGQPWLSVLDWESDIVQTGVVRGTKKTSPGGFHLKIDAVLNIFEANGTLTTTLDGKTYTQPQNGT